MERSTVVGVFRDRDSAEHAIDELHRIGFRDDQIGFVMRGEDGRTEATGTDTGSHAGEGAVGGILAGAGIGGLIAAAASLLIPGFGPVIAGGILATILGGAAIGAAAGGILGALVGMGVPEEEAHYYEGEFNEGRILVTVKADSRYQEARDILRRNGAYDIEDRDAVSAGRTTMGTTPRTGITMRREEARIEHDGDVPMHGAGTTGLRSWQEMSPQYRQRWQTRYGTSGGRWEESEPYYRYGYEMAADPRYQGRDWAQVEPDLKRDYGAWAQRGSYRYDDNAWERFKDRVHESWDEARGTRRAA
jgi:hypothetical protein